MAKFGCLYIIVGAKTINFEISWGWDKFRIRIGHSHTVLLRIKLILKFAKNESQILCFFGFPRGFCSSSADRFHRRDVAPAGVRFGHWGWGPRQLVAILRPVGARQTLFLPLRRAPGMLKKQNAKSEQDKVVQFGTSTW